MAAMQSTKQVAPRPKTISISVAAQAKLNEVGRALMAENQALQQAQQAHQQHLLGVEQQRSRLVGLLEMICIQAGENPEDWQFDFTPQGDVLLQPKAAPVPPIASNGNHSQEEA